jgi:hypothetical protein
LNLTTAQQPPGSDSVFPFAVFMLFSVLEMLGDGLLWGIAGFVGFRLARVRDRLWPAGAILTGLAAATAEWLGMHVLELFARSQLKDLNEPIPGTETMHLITAAMASVGFAIAWVVLRHRLSARPPATSN